MYISNIHLPKHLTKNNKLLTNAASSRATLSASSFICFSLFSSALIASSASFSGASAASFKTNLASRSIFAFSSSPFFVPNSASLCFFLSWPPIQNIHIYIRHRVRNGVGIGAFECRYYNISIPNFIWDLYLQSFLFSSLHLPR